MLFLKIITFPVRLVLFVAAYILRAALELVGIIICWISEIANIPMKFIGGLTNLLAIFMTVMTIKEIKSGELAIKNGVFYIAGYWVLTIVIGSVCFAGYMIGEFIKEIGRKITEGAHALMFI